MAVELPNDRWPVPDHLTTFLILDLADPDNLQAVTWATLSIIPGNVHH